MAAESDPREQRQSTALGRLRLRLGVWDFGRIAAAYSVLIVLTIPIGTVVAIPVGAKTLPVSVTDVALGFAVCHLASIAGWSRIKRLALATPPPVSMLVVGVAILALPVAWPLDTAAAGAAYVNFALGGIGGVLVGVTWGRMARRLLNPLDVALMGFVGISAIQIAIGFVLEGGGAALHSEFGTRWGVSNYVGGVLVVSSLALLGRAQVSTNGRLALVLTAVGGVVGALLLFGRGSVLALAAGLMVMAWSMPCSRRTRALLRGFSIVIPLMAAGVIAYTTAVRLRENNQVLINVDTRYTLWNLAWTDFLHNPWIGAGWTAMREASQAVFGVPTTSSHNIVLTFLQIGGMLAVPYLAGLAWLLVNSLREQREMGGALVAAVVFSMVEPFVEGTVAGLIVLAIAIRGGSWSKEHGEQLASQLAGYGTRARHELLRFSSRGGLRGAGRNGDS